MASSSSSSFSIRAQTHFRPRTRQTILPARRREISSQFITQTTARIFSTHESVSGHIPFRAPKKTIENEKQIIKEEEKKSLRIGILGFGNFGQFIAKRIMRQGHDVMATSRRDYSAECRREGVEFFKSVEEMCAQKPDVVLVCTSILSTESVLRSVPFHLLKPDTIFADVLSVKQYPRNLFLEVLPPEYGIICTHPMFGPESGKNDWDGLPFVFENVRIAEKGDQARKCSQFLSIFEHEGCRMVEMSCEEHDRHAAGTQFITHTIGRILSQLNLESTPINTKGYETLLKLTENTVSDSFDLYYGLFMYNVNATDQIENLDRAFDAVKQKLFGRLHDILRKQIVERAPMTARSPAAAGPPFLLENDDIHDVASFAAPRLASAPPELQTIEVPTPSLPHRKVARSHFASVNDACGG